MNIGQSKQVIAQALTEMSAELRQVKKAAENYMGELNEMAPEELTGAENEAPFGGGESDETGAPPKGGKDEEKGEGKPEKVEIKTPEEAKKVLNEAKSDIQNLIDSLDGLLGQVEDTEKTSSIRRPNERFASDLSQLAKTADKTIADAQHAMQYWSFLKSKRNPVASITDPSLKQAAQTIREHNKFYSFLQKTFGGKKVEATAVPPTGAEFSGDMWPGNKDPKMVEDRAWHAGATEFAKNKKKEDAAPNSAVDTRLTDDNNPHDEKPYVNASFVELPNNKFASYWDVVDTKTNSRVVIDFANVPTEIGPKNASTYNQFASKVYGEKIADHVIRYDMKSLQQVMGGRTASLKEAGLNVSAREPKITDKAKVRKYYAEAYGDRGYAKELTSSESNDKMNVEYKPEHEHPSETNKSEDTGKAKDGAGKLSSRSGDPEVIKARARRSIELARKYASRGAIEFTQAAVLAKGRELMGLDDATFATKEATLDELPIVNQAALNGDKIPVKTAHIPDTENGIVGNSAEGVRNPKATVKTEDLDSGVKSDGKISKSASLVPQIASDGPSRASLSEAFTTTENKLRAKGVDLSKLRRPSYRGA